MMTFQKQIFQQSKRFVRFSEEIYKNEHNYKIVFLGLLGEQAAFLGLSPNNSKSVSRFRNNITALKDR